MDLNVTAPLTVAENQPIGTLVGEFSATDPDANATLTYHLVSGAGGGENSLFTLETNGTLRTATSFDYETNASTYSIRVLAKDEHNASVEGNFTVTLTVNMGDLQILEASYGASGGSNEVTGHLQSMLSGNSLSMYVSSSQLGGDPAFGQVKALTVRYSYGGSVYETSVQEGGMLMIPDTSHGGVGGGGSVDTGGGGGSNADMERHRSFPR